MSSAALILHGGAGRITAEYGSKKLPGLKLALDRGWRALQDGAPPEVAVCAALRVMEEDQYFNAGYGGYPNEHGIVLLDAGLMRGNGDFISLINVRQLKYPSEILLDMLKPGRRLTTVWTHELMQKVLAGDGSQKDRYGLVASHDEMIAPLVRELLAKRAAAELSSHGEGSHGTVGCVARAVDGRIAAGTSTGGIYLKHNGRVGDSPIIGSGVYAEQEVAGISTSGDGEAILMGNLSGYTLGGWRTALDQDRAVFAREPQKALEILEKELTRFGQRARGVAGMIAIPCGCNPIYAFNSPRFSVAGRYSGENGELRQFVRIASNEGAALEMPL